MSFFFALAAFWNDPCRENFFEQKGCCNKAVFRIGQEATSFKLFRYGITTYYYYYLLAQKTVKTVHRGKNYQRECVEWYIMMSLSGSLYVS